MTAIVLLLLTGLILLAFEVFVPGGVLGIAGGLAMLAGVVVAFVNLGATGGLVTFVIAVVLVGLLLYIELSLLPKTKWGQRLFLKSAVTATSQPPPATLENVIGQNAEAITTLSPSGYVLVGGQRHEAFCRSGYAPKGTALRVVGVDNFRVIVTKV